MYPVNPRAELDKAARAGHAQRRGASSIRGSSRLRHLRPIHTRIEQDPEWGAYAIEVARRRLPCQGMTLRLANRITPSSWCLNRKSRLPGLEPEILSPNLKLLAEEFGPLGQTFLKKTCHGRRWDEADRAKSKKYAIQVTMPKPLNWPKTNKALYPGHERLCNSTYVALNA